MLGFTFANSLQQPGAHTFWAVAAKENMIVIGADVANSFAEVPPLVPPLYVTINDQYCERWVQHLGLPYCPSTCSPIRTFEAPHLWEHHIDKIM
jgi:hypothetical protein